MSFAPAKYELIHFTRHRTKFNLQANLNLGTVIMTPALDVRVLARLKSRAAKKAKTLGQLRKEWAKQRAIDQGDHTEEKQTLHEWTRRWDSEQNRVNQEAAERRGKREVH